MEDFLDLKKYNKVAIMGGTFNPIHYGHLIISQQVKEKFDLEKIIFIPAGIPPHKSNIEEKEHRYNMVKLAINSNSDFLISKVEICREGETYTIDTLKYIRSFMHKNAKLYFIVGADTLDKIYTWKNSEELFKYTDFIVVSRPEYSFDEKILNSNIHFCRTTSVNISSTDIRDRVNKDKSILYLLPDNVYEYIKINDLYKIDYFKKYESIIKKLAENLPEKRFNHSLEVAKEAMNLAKIYDCDLEEAFLAGILHDCAKYFKLERILEIAEKNNFKLDNVILKQPDIAHSFIGSFVAKSDYGILNENVLSAIKYHTTGKKDMNLLEKIAYIADYVEPTRKYSKEREEARLLAYKDLDIALKFILKNTIEHNTKQGREIHYLSIEAYKFYEN